LRYPVRATAALAVAAVALAISALAMTPARAADRFSGAYVAMGDSYTSGPGIPGQVPGSLRCFRSDHNYPSLLARAINQGSGVFRDCRFVS
jgi:hypothetical protein